MYYDTVFSVLPQFMNIGNMFVIAAMVTNNFELLIPVIEFTYMFYFLGFFNILMGKMKFFYISFANAKIDPYRLISSVFSLDVKQDYGLPDPVVNSGYTGSILNNLLPDLILIGAATVFYIITKVLAVSIKN